MSLHTAFSDLHVVEWGNRPAVRACGSLLAQLGARVTAFGPPPAADALARFKIHAADTPDARARAVAAATIVLLSSDRADDPPAPPARADLILCDITVGGGADGSWTEPLLQAATGIADITGTRDSAPIICEAPVIEFQTAILAAAAVLAAWPRREATGEGQTIALSLIDCGLNGLSSFLPLVFAGKTPKRSGNRHPMAVPWNSFRARDGWLLLCSATDDHWVRLCALMGCPEQATGAFARLADRVEACDAVDALVEDWIGRRTVAEAVAALGEAGLAAGPILTLDQLADEPNLRHRGAISDGSPAHPLSFLRRAPGAAPAVPPSAADAGNPALPLDGLLVLEIGQYTTAPLAAKQLALLGAEVIKIEPPGGEASRAWPPHQNGQGYFFTMNNANKRSCLLDLRAPRDLETFRALLRRADVLIENLKPGSLERLGFAPEALAALNPRLIYCAISGFGRESVYPGRPAFDTVVQAMSGLMDVTRAEGQPVKLGISAADVTGGMAGLLAVMAGLEQRRRTQRGALIDLSMQDVASWLTQTAWNGAARAPYALLACTDGYVVAQAPADTLTGLAQAAPASTRSDVLARCAGAGVPACAVRTLNEIAADPAIVGGGAVAVMEDASGQSWPLFRAPFHFSAQSTAPLRPIGGLGEANAYVETLCAAAPASPLRARG